MMRRTINDRLLPDAEHNDLDDPGPDEQHTGNQRNGAKGDGSRDDGHEPDHNHECGNPPEIAQEGYLSEGRYTADGMPLE